MQKERSKISIAPPKTKGELKHYLNLFKEYDIKILEGNDKVEGALILCGGADINTNAVRDLKEIEWIKSALFQNIPIMGICRGMQMINQYFGGVVSDLSDRLTAYHGVEHFKDDKNQSKKVSHYHKVYDYTTESAFLTNSRHHQHCKLIPNVFTVTHESYDGVIEGFTNVGLKILAVQWHPERDENFETTTYRQIPLNWLKQQLNG